MMLALFSKFLNRDCTLLCIKDEQILVRLKKYQFKTDLDINKKYKILYILNSGLDTNASQQRASLEVGDGKYLLNLDLQSPNNRHLLGKLF